MFLKIYHNETDFTITTSEYCNYDKKCMMHKERDNINMSCMDSPMLECLGTDAGSAIQAAVASSEFRSFRHPKT